MTHCETCSRMFQTQAERNGIEEQAKKDWLGKNVVQARIAHSSFEKFIGRSSVVKALFADERNIVHAETEDGLLCPLWLLDRIDP